MSSMNNDNKGGDNLFQAQAHLYRHIFSFLTPLSLKCAVQLSIPDIIHNHGQPIALPHLLSALKIPPTKANCIRQLMRLLAQNGFFEITKMKTIEESEEGNEAYALTPTSELLVRSSDHCLSPMVIGILNPAVPNSYNYLSDWFRADEPTIVETVFGVRLWEYMNQNHEILETFNDAMACDSRVVSWALTDCKAVFEGLGTLVDVGGGTGAVGRVICEAYPDLKYVVLDLPQVVENLSGTNNLSFVGGNMFESIPEADAVLLKAVFEGLGTVVDVGGGTGALGRVICEAYPDLKYIVLDPPQVVENLCGTNNLSFVGGNMFESIAEAEAVLLKSVLHNWADDECLKILRKSKEAISSKGKGGKLIVIEEVMDQKQDDDEMAQLKLLLDICMTTVHNGKARNEKEFENLFLKSGFKNCKIFPMFGYQSLIEVYP